MAPSAESADYAECWDCGALIGRLHEDEVQDGFYFHDLGSIEVERQTAIQSELAFDRFADDFEGVSLDERNDVRVLVLGCGRGYLVESLLKRGFDAEGVEVSSLALRDAGRRGLSARCHQVSSIVHDDLLDGRQFDVVLACDILEHFEQPGDVVRRAESLLAPGGKLLGSTVAADPSARKRRKKWSGYQDPEYHRTLMSSDALAAVLESNGFKAPVIRPLGRDIEVRSKRLAKSHSKPLLERAKCMALGIATWPLDAWVGGALASRCFFRAERAVVESSSAIDVRALGTGQ